MSKDQKKTVELPVETVDNLKESLEWISSSIHFWHLEKTYPMNLIDTVVSNFAEMLKDMNFVSVSHINDK